MIQGLPYISIKDFELEQNLCYPTQRTRTLSFELQHK